MFAIRCSHAATIANWNLYNGPYTNNITATSFDAGLSSAPIIGFQPYSSGYGAYTTGGSSHVWNVLMAEPPGSNLSDAITHGWFIEFALTPTNGDHLSVQAISLTLSVQLAAPSTYYLSVFSSLNGFTSGAQIDTETFSSTSQSSPSSVVLDINQSTTNSVSYRLYIYGIGTNTVRFGNASNSSVDAIVVTGSVPEPSTALSLLVALVCVIAWAFIQTLYRKLWRRSSRLQH